MGDLDPDRGTPVLPSNATPAEVVDAYFTAFAARDFDRLRECLSDGAFSHRSPIAAIDDADTYAAYMSRIGPVLEGLERRRTFVDGDEVCAIVEYRIRLSELMKVSVATWFRVAGGRITAIENFFDATEYRRMIEIP
jgi:limonene-1,2-epoxide hydrolase